MQRLFGHINGHHFPSNTQKKDRFRVCYYFWKNYFYFHVVKLNIYTNYPIRILVNSIKILDSHVHFRKIPFLRSHLNILENLRTKVTKNIFVFPSILELFIHTHTYT